MTAHSDMTLTGDVPAPGHYIREELEARGWKQVDLAYVLGVPEQSVNLIVAGKRGITADMAKALGDAFDVPAELFVNLQKAYDLSRARAPDPSVARRGRLQSVYPIREMMKRGWLVATEAADLLDAQLARFFEKTSVDEVPHMAHAAKKTGYDETPPAQLAWLFRVRQIAWETTVPKYSEKALREALPRLRHLMSEPEEARHVPRILMECAVRFVLVEPLPNSKIDGVCFWLDDSSPVVGMSTRFDRIDNFWFVLRHELEHVLRKHGRDTPKIDADIDGEAGSKGAVSDEERVANDAASDFCVPRGELDSFISRKQPFFSERDLLGFANRLQVHPGIVAGQLRKRLNRWDLFSRWVNVKVRYAVAPSAVVDGWGQVAPVSA